MSANESRLAETKNALRAMTAEASELQLVAGGSVTEAVASWLAPSYASAAHEKLAGAQGSQRWEILQAFVQDWTLLRRGDHAAARLQLDREELDWKRANTQAQKENEFREWLKRPEIRKEVLPGLARGISAETLQKIEAELRLL